MSEERIRRLEVDVQALKLETQSLAQSVGSLDTKLDRVEETFKTGWQEANQTFKDQVGQLREDRKLEREEQAKERQAEREERRWWWTKAFGIATTVFGGLGALGGGAYYSMQTPTVVQPSAIPAPIHAPPPESIP